MDIKNNLKNTSISEVIEVRNGEEILLTEKSEVEKAIITANYLKYRQTNDTPLMSTLLPDFGFLGNTIEFQDILKGTSIYTMSTN